MPAPLLYGLALVSGFAALVYQVAWSNLLGLSFGSSTLAVSAVVAGFMGGMGLGAWRYHRLGARASDPLRAYAVLELGIALAAFLFTALFAGLPRIFASLPAALSAGLGLDVVRVLATMALLLVPAALMGATYPALCLALIRSRHGVDRHLGALYGWNTVGAAAGACVTGMLLIEHLGARGSVHLANLLNLGVAAAAGWLAFRRANPVASRDSADSADAADEAVPTGLPLALTGFVLFASGFATLGYEILWFRALRYLVGNSTYALSTVLVVFLLGLGLGALLYRPAVRLVGPERGLAFGQLGTAVFALLAIGAEAWILSDPSLRRVISIFSESLQTSPWGWRLFTASGLALVIVLPATLFMGVCFPLASRLFLGSVGQLGERVGTAYLLSNLGSILGAVLAALWILPTLGTVGGTQALACLNLGLGLVLLAASPARSGGRLAVGATAVAATLLLALSLPTRLPFVGEEKLARFGTSLLFEEEADLGTVQVLGNPQRRDRRLMVIDGAVIAAAGGALPFWDRKQRLLAHLPLALDARLKKTLNVGIASCSTLYALARHAGVETLDGVEINPAVMKAASLFPECAVLNDPRARLYVEDAVHFLLRGSEPYDLIISDGKQNRDFSGNAKILSLEFYTQALERLSACGIFLQWIPLTNDTASFEVTLRTFRSVFESVDIFYDPPSAILMAGSPCPLAGRPGLSQQEYERLGLAADLREPAGARVQDLLGLWVAGGEDIDAALGPGPVNSWDRMPIAFLSYRAPPSQRYGARNLALLLDPDPARPSPFAPPDSPDQRSRALVQRASLLLLEDDRAGAMRLAREAVRDHPQDANARRLLAHLRDLARQDPSPRSTTKPAPSGAATPQ